MTIHRFLLARIAEDEDRARAAAGAQSWQSDGPDGRESGISSVAGEALVVLDMEAMVRLHPATLALFEHLAEWVPGRVLAECEAKREIVKLHAGRTAVRSATEPVPFEPDHCIACNTHEWPCPTLRALALPYSNHPDYDDSWRN